MFDIFLNNETSTCTSKLEPNTLRTINSTRQLSLGTDERVDSEPHSCTRVTPISRSRLMKCSRETLVWSQKLLKSVKITNRVTGGGP